MKKIITAATFGLLVLSASPVFAMDSMMMGSSTHPGTSTMMNDDHMMKKEDKMMEKSDKMMAKSDKKTMQACVKTASSTKYKSLADAWKAYGAAKKAATTSEAKKQAYATYLTAKKAALDQYKTDLAACKK